MIFCGIGRRFSTLGNRQYEEIGEFWDLMAEKYGRENLHGLGWGWAEDSLMYAIGTLDGANGFRHEGMDVIEIDLPENGWQLWHGETERLSRLYEQIYRDGPLTYEIERFFENGSCSVAIYRERK